MFIKLLTGELRKNYTSAKDKKKRERAFHGATTRNRMHPATEILNKN